MNDKEIMWGEVREHLPHLYDRSGHTNTVFVEIPIIGSVVNHTELFISSDSDATPKTYEESFTITNRFSTELKVQKIVDKLKNDQKFEYLTDKMKVLAKLDKFIV